MFVAGDEYVHPEGSVVVLTIWADHTEVQSEKRARRVNYPVVRTIVIFGVQWYSTLSATAPPSKDSKLNLWETLYTAGSFQIYVHSLQLDLRQLFLWMSATAHQAPEIGQRSPQAEMPRGTRLRATPSFRLIDRVFSPFFVNKV